MWHASCTSRGCSDKTLRLGSSRRDSSRLPRPQRVLIRLRLRPVGIIYRSQSRRKRDSGTGAKNCFERFVIAMYRVLIHAMMVVAICGLANGQTSQSQSDALRDEQAPLLTLDDAVSLALNNNRIVKNSSLEAEKFDFKVNTARSRRLPQFQFAVLGGGLLQPVHFTFPAGAFGTYPATGPIPSTQTSIKSPAVFTTYTTAGINQPLTQQYKIHLGMHATEIGRDIAREDVRAERQRIANEVRTAYFEIVATQVGVDAAQVAVQTLEEAERVTKTYEVQEPVLRGDVLEVDARLAKARYELSVAED